MPGNDSRESAGRMGLGEDEERRACRALKSKMLYVSGAEPDPALASSTGHYWCVRTMGTVGPDDALVTPEECCARRGCFEGE